MLAGIVVQKVGRRLADTLPEAELRLFRLPRLHLLGDGFRLLQGLVPRCVLASWRPLCERCFSAV